MNALQNKWNSIIDDPLPPGLGISSLASFIPVGYNKHTLFNLSTGEHYRSIVQQCYPLASIMLSCAEAFSNGVFEVLNRTNKNYVRGEAGKAWDALLLNPNPYTNRSQFLELLYIYRRVRGYVYALPIYPSGIEDRPEAIYLLPPWCIEVEAKDLSKPLYSYKRGESFRRVYFTYNGVRKELDESKLILFTDNTLDLDPCTLLPISIINSLRYPISLHLSSDEAGLTMVQKRGPMGIFTNQTSINQELSAVATAPEDKEILQNSLNKYNLTRGDWQYIVTQQNVSFIPIGVNIAELRLDENQIKAIKAMCWALGMPFEKTPFSEQNTYNNKKESGKDLYQDTIIPQAQSIVEQLNYGLNTVDYNIEITVTYQDVHVFQQSQKERGEGRRAMNQALKVEWDNGLITRNMWLKELGRDEVKGNELFDKYKWELTPEQLGIVQQDINQSDEKGKAA